jgi:calcineurin-like phosphoesterase family protein
MEKALSNNWNSRVKPDDDIYIVGDFAWRAKHDHLMKCITNLNGRKHLIMGNHDRKYLEFDDFRAQFVEIEKQLEIYIDKQRIILCHYPMAEWHQFHRGSFHIHGHLHNRKDDTFHYLKNLENALNAGVDVNNYMPVTFEELVENNKLFKASGIINAIAMNE